MKTAKERASRTGKAKPQQQDQRLLEFLDLYRKSWKQRRQRDIRFNPKSNAITISGMTLQLYRKASRITGRTVRQLANECLRMGAGHWLDQTVRKLRNTSTLAKQIDEACAGLLASPSLAIQATSRSKV